MKKLLHNLALATITAVLSLVMVFAISGHQLVSASAKDDACKGVGLVTGDPNASCGDPNDTSKGVNGLIANIVNIMSIIVGLLAVIMIIIGGFRFVLSGGDSNNVNSARNTVIYAIVGLVVVAVAQILVRYVLHRVPSG